MSAYAVFEASGKQHRAQVGQVVKLDKIEKEPGATVEFEKVLLIKDGDKVEVGSPAIAGSKIIAEIKAHGRDKKIEVIKFRRRKDSKTKIGHRQWFTEVEIKEIKEA